MVMHNTTKIIEELYNLISQTGAVAFKFKLKSDP